MKIKLLKSHIDQLEKMPESGMGYHIVDITLKSNEVLKKRIILNCSYLMTDKEELVDPKEICKIEPVAL